MNESTDPQSLIPPSSGPVLPVPMTFGQVLDRVYRLMRAHLRLFLGIAAVPAATVFVLLLALMSFMLAILGLQMTGKPVMPPVLPPWFPLYFLIVYPIMLAVYALYMPAASFAATQADLGVIVTFRQAYSVAWSRFGRSLWLMILCVLYVLVPVLAVAALIGAGALLIQHATGTGCGPGCAFFLIPLLVLLYIGILVYSVLIMLRFAVAYPACMEEDLTAWASLRRSANLTRGAKGRIFLVMLVVYAVVYAAELVCILVILVLAALAAFAAMAAHVTLGSPAFFVLVGLGVLAYLLVIVACILIAYSAFTTALAVLYHDQRFRKDILAPTPPMA